MQIFEITLKGFNAEDDKTDDLVKWVQVSDKIDYGLDVVKEFVTVFGLGIVVEDIVLRDKMLDNPEDGSIDLKLNILGNVEYIGRWSTMTEAPSVFHNRVQELIAKWRDESQLAMTARIYNEVINNAS